MPRTIHKKQTASDMEPIAAGEPGIERNKRHAKDVVMPATDISFA